MQTLPAELNLLAGGGHFAVVFQALVVQTLYLLAQPLAFVFLLTRLAGQVFFALKDAVAFGLHLNVQPTA